MAKCNFSVDSAQPVAQLIDKAKKAIASAGGTFDGNTEKGNYSIPTPLGKITGAYTVNGNVIAFEITDKPFLVGCSKIEDELKKYLGASA
jgi:hypothetical protein